MVKILPTINTNKTRRVTDIHGDQVEVDGLWHHAERIFGKSAAEFVVGQVVQELELPLLPQHGGVSLSAVEPDELVSCDLYRGCSANEMTEHKVSTFAEIMVGSGGWGDFPMISGYVQTLDANDVEHCQQMVAEGNTNVWLTEFGWSRLVTKVDIGTRYVHIDNGHHRMAAAALASTQIGPIFIPVADRKVEEELPRFMNSGP